MLEISSFLPSGPRPRRDAADRVDGHADTQLLHAGHPPHCHVVVSHRSRVRRRRNRPCGSHPGCRPAGGPAGDPRREPPGEMTVLPAVPFPLSLRRSGQRRGRGRLGVWGANQLSNGIYLLYTSFSHARRAVNIAADQPDGDPFTVRTELRALRDGRLPAARRPGHAVGRGQADGTEAVERRQRRRLRLARRRPVSGDPPSLTATRSGVSTTEAADAGTAPRPPPTLGGWPHTPIAGRAGGVRAHRARQPTRRRSAG